ncbi:hypothetical protein GALL_542560 [mine drainage metagenome]|uniref:Uncharacterized protein n=1 Tax=mine drainage metagenome TaxID=410659 RepID=A0A1J5NZI7_9ZZZZ
MIRVSSGTNTSSVRVITTCIPARINASRSSRANCNVICFSSTLPLIEPGSIPPCPGSSTTTNGLSPFCRCLGGGNTAGFGRLQTGLASVPAVAAKVASLTGFSLTRTKARPFSSRVAISACATP